MRPAVGIVATEGSAQSVRIGADSLAYIVEQIQMARWLLESIDAGDQVDVAMITRRAAALEMLVKQLIEGAALMGVALELAPEVERALADRKLS
jgi:hypothetical protein